MTQFQPGPGVPEHPFEGLPDDPFGEIAAEQAMERAGAAEEHGLPDDPFGDASLLAAPGTDGEQLFTAMNSVPFVARSLHWACT